ncbi:MAG: hypothetical protein AABW50_01015 [Nanoarchaeota archaeon]
MLNKTRLFFIIGIGIAALFIANAVMFSELKKEKLENKVSSEIIELLENNSKIINPPEGARVKVGDFNCSNMSSEIESQLLEIVWRTSGSTCVTCGACRVCGCTIENKYTSDNFSIDVHTISCLGNTYTIKQNNKSISKCDDISFYKYTE